MAHVARLEAAQVEASHRFPDVLEPGLRALRVIGHRPRFHAKLVSDVPDQEVGHHLVIPQPEARMA